MSFVLLKIRVDVMGYSIRFWILSLALLIQSAPAFAVRSTMHEHQRVHFVMKKPAARAKVYLVATKEHDILTVEASLQNRSMDNWKGKAHVHRRQRLSDGDRGGKLFHVLKVSLAEPTDVQQLYNQVHATGVSAFMIGPFPVLSEQQSNLARKIAIARAIEHQRAEIAGVRSRVGKSHVSRLHIVGQEGGRAAVNGGKPVRLKDRRVKGKMPSTEFAFGDLTVINTTDLRRISHELMRNGVDSPVLTHMVEERRIDVPRPHLKLEYDATWIDNL